MEMIEANLTKDKPVFDISRWERILNGMAIKIIHSINEGEYGRYSIIIWDTKKIVCDEAYLEENIFVPKELELSLKRLREFRTK